MGNCWQKHNVEWFLLRRFLDLVRYVRILTDLDRFCPRRKNPQVIYRGLVSWVARNQEANLRNQVFKKFPISFALFFDDDNIVKLGIDYAVCEEVVATDG